MQKFQVSFIGLSTLFGKTCSLLLKQSPFIKCIKLYDEFNIDPALDVAGLNTQCKVKAFLGKEQLNSALKDADIVIIGEDAASENSRATDLFSTSALKIINYAKAIASTAPEAIVVIAASPVNSLIPLVTQTLSHHGCLNPNKVLGATTVDNIRANSLLAQHLRADARHVILPVIGGSSEDTRVPVFSQAKPNQVLPLDVKEAIIKGIKKGDEEIKRRKMCPESLNKAYATTRFINSIMAGLRGEPNVTDITLTKTSSVPGIDYFALPVVLGRKGVVQRFGIPQLTDMEEDMVGKAIHSMRKDIDKASAFYNTNSSHTSHKEEKEANSQVGFLKDNVNSLLQTPLSLHTQENPFNNEIFDVNKMEKTTKIINPIDRLHAKSKQKDDFKMKPVELKPSELVKPSVSTDSLFTKSKQKEEIKLLAKPIELKLPEPLVKTSVTSLFAKSKQKPIELKPLEPLVKTNVNIGRQFGKSKSKEDNKLFVKPIDLKLPTELLAKTSMSLDKLLVKNKPKEDFIINAKPIELKLPEPSVKTNVNSLFAKSKLKDDNKLFGKPLELKPPEPLVKTSVKTDRLSAKSKQKDDNKLFGKPIEQKPPEPLIKTIVNTDRLSAKSKQKETNKSYTKPTDLKPPTEPLVKTIVNPDRLSAKSKQKEDNKLYAKPTDLKSPTEPVVKTHVIVEEDLSENKEELSSKKENIFVFGFNSKIIDNNAGIDTQNITSSNTETPSEPKSSSLQKLKITEEEKNTIKLNKEGEANNEKAVERITFLKRFNTKRKTYKPRQSSNVSEKKKLSTTSKEPKELPSKSVKSESHLLQTLKLQRIADNKLKSMLNQTQEKPHLLPRTNSGKSSSYKTEEERPGTLHSLIKSQTKPEKAKKLDPIKAETIYDLAEIEKPLKAYIDDESSIADTSVKKVRLAKPEQKSEVLDTKPEEAPKILSSSKIGQNNELNKIPDAVIETQTNNDKIKENATNKPVLSYKPKDSYTRLSHNLVFKSNPNIEKPMTVLQMIAALQQARENKSAPSKEAKVEKNLDKLLKKPAKNLLQTLPSTRLDLLKPKEKLKLAEEAKKQAGTEEQKLKAEEANKKVIVIKDDSGAQPEAKDDQPEQKTDKEVKEEAREVDKDEKCEGEPKTFTRLKLLQKQQNEKLANTKIKIGPVKPSAKPKKPITVGEKLNLKLKNYFKRESDAQKLTKPNISSTSDYNYLMRKKHKIVSKTLVINDTKPYGNISLLRDKTPEVKTMLSMLSTYGVKTKQKELSKSYKKLIQEKKRVRVAFPYRPTPGLKFKQPKGGKSKNKSLLHFLTTPKQEVKEINIRKIKIPTDITFTLKQDSVKIPNTIHTGTCSDFVRNIKFPNVQRKKKYEPIALGPMKPSDGKNEKISIPNFKLNEYTCKSDMLPTLKFLKEMR